MTVSRQEILDMQGNFERSSIEHRICNMALASLPPATASSERNKVLDEVLTELSLRMNKYVNTVEDYYLHGLWQARDIVLAMQCQPGKEEKGT